MKKLFLGLCMVFGVAAIILSADPNLREGDLSLVGFEYYMTNTTVLGTDDRGQGGPSYWSESIRGKDKSVVKSYGDGNVLKGIGLTYPPPFENEGDKYLELNTDGGELIRWSTLDGDYPLDVSPSGTYIDMLVQFTLSDMGVPMIDQNAKFALWLGVTNTNGQVETNLYCRGTYFESEGTDTIWEERKTFNLSGIYMPETWYRLTIRAYRNIGSEDYAMSGFSIYINGIQRTLTEDICDYNAYVYLTEPFVDAGKTNYYVLPENSHLLTNRTFIASQTRSGFPGTIRHISFFGSGSIDDYVMTTNNPFQSSLR